MISSSIPGFCHCLKHTGWFWLILGLTVIGLFLCVRQRELERGHYTAFHHSIVQDLDLNLINQVNLDDRWLVTKRYNHPTHVSHGAAIFWFPFYAYVDLLLPASLRKQANFIWHFNAYQLAAMIRNAIFFALGIWLVLRALRKTTGGAQHGIQSAIAIGLLILGTPLLWYTFFEPFSTEATLFFLSAFILHDFCAHPVARQSTRRLFSVGLFLGLGAVAKPSFLFFAIYAALDLSKQPNGQRGLKVAAVFLGIVTSLSLLLLNNYMQSGEPILFHHAEALRFVQSSETLLFHHLLTAPNSLLMVNPAFLVILLLAMFCVTRIVWKRVQHHELLAIALVGFFGIAAVGSQTILSYPDLIFSRMLVIIIPPSIVFLGALWLRTGVVSRWVLTVMLGCSAGFGWLQITQYAARGQIISFPTSVADLTAFLDSLAAQCAAFWQERQSILYIGYYIPLIVASSIVIRWMTRNLERAFPKVTLFAFIFYLGVTVLNCLNNTANVDHLVKTEYFRQSVVSASPALNYYDEITSIFENGIKYLPAPYSDKARSALDKYAEMVMKDVAYDPLEFVSKWRKGELRKSIWNHY